MKIRKLVAALLILISISVTAQEKPQQWDLSSCINYALTNNIQIQKAKISLESNQVDTKQAKAQLLPNLSASASQNLSYYPAGSLGIYTGSYGISSSMTLFDGGKSLKNIEVQKLQEEAGKYNIISNEKSIQMSILGSYTKILYANEAVNVYDNTLKASEYQFNRGEELLKAGSISKADLAQLASQLSSDKYQLVVAQNTLSSARLELKQLLELNPGEEISISIPELNNVDILKPLTSLQAIYETALNVMPEIKTAKLDMQVSSLEITKAKAGYLPKINLNASTGTNHSSNSTYSFNTQLSDGFYAGVGVSVSVPIFSNRDNKSTLEKAKLNEKTAELNIKDTEKSMLKEIESVYQDALSAQSQYWAGTEKVKALETSYNLIEQQFNLGMKNTLELLTEKNNLLSARQNMMQAKYLSIMDMQILNLYQDIPVEIK
ncbi:MAG: TolC family protein [Paludibacter sp.]|nr:TolC family protein [Paludibacter sp.]